MYRKYIVQGSAPMRRTISISHALAWPFLLPGNLACNVLGLEKHHNLVRMLVNSLVWTVDVTSTLTKLPTVQSDRRR
jgi:hypothetical protein